MTCNQFVPHYVSAYTLSEHTVEEKMKPNLEQIETKEGAPTKKQQTNYFDREC